MSCSPGVVSPGPRVYSPGVWSRFAQSLKSFRPEYEVISPGLRVEEQLQNAGPLWTTYFTSVKTFWRTKYNTIGTIVIQ